VLTEKDKIKLAQLEKEAALLTKEVERLRHEVVASIGDDTTHSIFDDEMSSRQQKASKLQDEAKGIRMNAFRRFFGLRPVDYKSRWWHWLFFLPFMLFWLLLPLWYWLGN
jgi:uncharacterized small protein (DUF1192 family)